MQINQQAIQLIDEHKHIHPQALQTTISSLGNCGKDYFTVAIIGAQNTGKSTLLNHLFHTNFTVLKGEAGHRTTRGVILSKDYAQNLIIMDVEGNDSYETHLEGDENYQKMVSSFALVGANALLVNIFEKQLGQHAGSQYQTLSIIMRICIDQFKQQSPKTILFCLRDSNPNYTDQGECRRKVQQDVLNVWKNVWNGTKRSAEFEKYQASPERFFTLEVAFLREFDPDYPQDFAEDVKKLRERFLDPNVEGYIFKKQNKEYNMPSGDLIPLFPQIWERITSSKELNLPNEKIQLANYRCEQFSTQIYNDYEKDLELHSSEIRNYGHILENLRKQFKQKTSGYPKTVSQKCEKELIEKFFPKIRIIVLGLLDQKQKELEQKFAKDLEFLFFDLENPKQSFKEQAKQLQYDIIQEEVHIFRQLNFDTAQRKQRIDHLTAKLDDHIKSQMKNKEKWLVRQFQNDAQRTMRFMAATAMKTNFDVSFYEQLGRLFRVNKSKILQDYNARLLWARGHGGTSNQLDDAEVEMLQWLKGEVKREFQQNLPEKLLTYFKQNFYFDQHKVRYDYNLLNEQKSIEMFMESKEMVLNLLKKLDNFKLQAERRSSIIVVDDDQETPKPLLDTNIILSIQQTFQKRASEEYSTVQRKRNEAQMKKVPKYLIFIIIFFLYDDIWFTRDENPIMHYLTLTIACLIGIIYAVGQGHIFIQFANVIFEKGEIIANKCKDLFFKKRSEPVINQNQPKTESQQIKAQ